MKFTLSLSGSDLLLLLPEIFLTLWICMLLAVDAVPSRVSKKVIGNLSIVGLYATLGALLWFDINGKTGALFNGMFVLDPMAIYFKIFIVASTILVVSMSIGAVERFPAFQGEYYFLVLMSALGAMLMASANDLVSIFVTLEFTTFGFYILVAYLREDPKSNEAGLKFFILGAFTAGILAFGISLIYGATGTLILPDIAQAMGEPSVALIAGFLLLFAALGFKIGAVPLHTWIPDIYHGAPTPVTAFLSVAPKGAALAILLRVFFVTLAAFTAEWIWLLVLVAIVSMTYGNIVAIAQRNMKRLLAYSGIAQIGNVVIGLAAASKLGGESIMFYLWAYLFANLGAFAVVIAVAHVINSEEIEDYSGLNRRSPFLAFAMLLFLLSLAGVPPLAGFIAKLYIFVAAMQAGLIALVIVGLINVVISMYYYLIVVKKMYINEPTDPSPVAVSPTMTATIGIAMAGTLVLGIWPKPFLDWTVSATHMFNHLNITTTTQSLTLPFGG